MKISQEHRTSNIEHRTNRRSAFGVRCSMFDVRRLSAQSGSVLIIVLWVSIGLVSIALYFANSMNYELRAADNRVNGLSAEQAIEGAARYVAYALQNFATNGAVPDNTQFQCAAVPVGDAKFWLIGRDPNAANPTEPYFGLVDEGGKLNLNNVNTNVFQYLPGMTTDFSEAVLDWRGTNGTVSLNYASLGYAPKNAQFETVDELRLVYGADINLLAGEDINRNGILDKSEKDLNGNGALDPGLFEFVTVYTREPNFHADGSSLTNVNTASRSQMQALFQNAGVSTSQIGALTRTNGNARPYASLLKFAVACRNASLSADDFSRIAGNITTSTNVYFRGRVNVNTASVDVLTALIMGGNVDEQAAVSAAQTLVTYRQQNPSRLSSVAWIIDALGNTSPVITALAGGDYVTTHSYQFTADIAAVGAFGRGYRRVKFIFDISDGTPKILYRQDLGRLGWALGEKARENLVAKDTQ
jgi:type II secretory pathway component PulK